MNPAPLEKYPAVPMRSALVAARSPRGLAPWARIIRDRAPYTATPAAGPRPVMRGPRDVAAYFAGMAELEAESFVVACLDAQMQLTTATEVTRGTLDSSLVHPREVFRLAIALNAHSIVLVHNHPSGKTTASPEDKALTSQIAAAGRLLSIPVQDHIIIAGGAYASAAEEGWL